MGRAFAVALAAVICSVGCAPADGPGSSTPNPSAPHAASGPTAGPDGGSGSCQPASCESAGANCGQVPDGCGHLLTCGTCGAGTSCGGGGVANVCGASACVPKTCEQLGAQCGALSDGCGHPLQCGECAAGTSCGGGGTPNVCGASASPVSVSVTPSVQYLAPGDGAAFQATVRGAVDTSVRWSIAEGSAGGTVSSDGHYTSPTQAGTFHVVATSRADPSQSASVVVHTDSLLVDGGGRVLAAPQVYAIWWGDSATFGSSPDELRTLFEGLPGSRYLAILDPYLRGASAQVRFAGNLFDPSAPPATDDVGPMQTELCRMLDAHGLSPDPGAIYFLFYDNAPPNSPGGFHWNASCHGVQLTFAWVKNLAADGYRDVDSLHCGAGMQTRFFSEIAVHELFEAMSDPEPYTGWNDPKLTNGEISDKCGLEFTTACVPLSNGSQWQLPQQWSNAVAGCVQD